MLVATDAVPQQPGARTPEGGELVIAPASAPTYVRLRGAPAAGGGVPVGVSIEALDFSVREVLPKRVSRAGATTFTIVGADLGSAPRVRLARGAEVREADQVLRTDSTRLQARIDLTGAPTGAWDLVVDDARGSATLERAVIVEDSEEGRLEVRVSVPPQVRTWLSSEAVVTITNAGNTDLPAPVVVLSADGARFGPSDDGPFIDRTLSYLAVAGRGRPSRVLPAGASAVLPARFFVAPGASRGDVIRFRADAYLPGNATPWRWGGLAERLRPDGVPQRVWDERWPLVAQEAGATAGAIAETLASTHEELTTLGRPAGTRLLDLLPALAERVVVDSPDASLRGRISSAGTPVRRTGVRIGAPQVDLLGTSTTLDGDFALFDAPDATYSVEVDAHAPVPAALVDVPRPGPLDLAVEPGASVTGRVVRPDGRPARGAEVLVRGRHQETLVATADATGAFGLPSVGLGEVEVVARLEGYVEARTTLELEAPGPRSLDAPLELGEGRTLTGTVTDGGTGVAGATVTVSGAVRTTATTTTTEDGSWRLAGLEDGPVDVAAWAPARGTARQSAVVGAGGDPVVLELGPTGTVAGTVTGEDGTPIDGAVVLTDSDQASLGDLRTASDGSFVIPDFPAGRSGSSSACGLPVGGSSPASRRRPGGSWVRRPRRALQRPRCATSPDRTEPPRALLSGPSA